MQDYSPEIRVLKGLNIASVVLQGLGILAVVVAFVFCGITVVATGFALSEYENGYSYSAGSMLDDRDSHTIALAVDSDPFSDGFTDDDLDRYLDDLLGDSDDFYMSPDEFAEASIITVGLMVVIMVMLVFSLLISVYCLIVSIMILRAKDDVTNFKRLFVMSIVAAALCLVTTSIISLVLYILSAVWIHKVRAKAGQLAQG